MNSKIGCLIILKSILGLEFDADGIPLQGGIVGHDTIVEAQAVGMGEGVIVERCADVDTKR